MILMKVAITYENGNVFGHFGHTEQFKVYEIDNCEVVSSEIIGTNGSGHGALSELLAKHKIDALICGGIGGGARMALASYGIELYPGVSGSADDAIEAFLVGNLDFDPNTTCSHHHHGEGHSCGGHCGGNCGNH